MKIQKKSLLNLNTLAINDLVSILNLTKSLEINSKKNIEIKENLKESKVLILYAENCDYNLTLITKIFSGQKIKHEIYNYTELEKKHKSFLNTINDLKSIKADLLICLHPNAGFPVAVSKFIDIPVLNLQDGNNESPIHGLNNIYSILSKTIQNKVKPFSNKDLTDKKICLLGDIKYNSEGRSTLFGLKKFNADIYLCGPATLIPETLSAKNINITHNLDSIINQMDFIIKLNPNSSIMNKYLPSIQEYNMLFNISDRRKKLIKQDSHIIEADHNSLYENTMLATIFFLLNRSTK